jgi:predicted double-glycine peptidase
MHTPKILICLITVLVSFAACSSVKMKISPPFKTDSKTVLIQNVPFFPQKDYQCGPAALAGVINFWKTTDTPSDIAKHIFSPSAKGTLTIDMIFYAQEKGLNAFQYAGDIEDLKAKISRGYPLIVLVDNGFWVYRADHFMVVLGYTDDGVIVNSGKSEKTFINADAFLNSWKKTSYWTLWIKPE